MAKLLSLQAARGAAANSVMLFHVFPTAVLPAFAIYGFAGVDLFFVLSGFIMVAVAERGVGALEFLWRRAVRIYPIYWLISVMVLGIVMVAPAMDHSVLQMPDSLVRSFLLFPDRTTPLLPGSWTLVYEVYFYLVFAIFLALGIPIIAGLVIWGTLLAGLAAAIPHQIALSPVLQVMTNPLAAEFMMGAAVGLLWRSHVTPVPLLVGAAGIAGLVLSISYAAPAVALIGYNYASSSFIQNPHLDAWRVVLFGIPLAMIIYALAAIERWPRRPKPPAFLVALGDWSYATYLAHLLIISVVTRLSAFLFPTGGVVASALIVATVLVAANLAGAALHILFERPSLKWLHLLGPRLRRWSGGVRTDDGDVIAIKAQLTTPPYALNASVPRGDGAARSRSCPP
jgi:peptidoglycan/LPS O-acetylase OafA/YrhL